jgi:hypothetical protein
MARPLLLLVVLVVVAAAAAAALIFLFVPGVFRRFHLDHLFNFELFLPSAAVSV